jgi:uncharacterized membrane protein YfcA
MIGQYWWLIPLGFLVGTFGTLIGAGGGFVLVPVLLLLYPTASPETITSISLAVVFFNAMSGSLAYARMKRIDYKSGVWFAAATIPGSILGAITTDYIPRRLFNAGFGILMIAAAVFLFFHRVKADHASQEVNQRHTIRNVVDKDGTVHVFSFDMRIGVGLSVLVGYVSSLLGIGGGIIHVPALVHLLNFPVHIATATSHFILAIMALTGTVVHIVSGSFAQGGVRRTIFLAVGVLLGAQLGALLSSRVRGPWIIRGLAVALAFAGIRIFLMAL